MCRRPSSTPAGSGPGTWSQPAHRPRLERAAQFVREATALMYRQGEHLEQVAGDRRPRARTGLIVPTPKVPPLNGLRAEERE